MRMPKVAMGLLLSVAAVTALSAQAVSRTTASAAIPRMADGRPDLQGIWQARSRAANLAAAPRPAERRAPEYSRPG